jgi:hypothetical protein
MILDGSPYEPTNEDIGWINTIQERNGGRPIEGTIPEGLELSLSEDGSLISNKNGKEAKIEGCGKSANGEYANKCPPFGFNEDGSIVQPPEEGEPGEGTNIDPGENTVITPIDGGTWIEGEDIDVDTSITQWNRSLLTGKLTMEGSSNVTLTQNKKHFDKVRDGLIETQDSEGSYKTNLKDATGITVYANGTYTTVSAVECEMGFLPSVVKPMIF